MPAPPFVQCRAIARLAAPWRVQPQPNDDGIPTTTRIDESSKQEEEGILGWMDWLEVIIDATHRSSQTVITHTQHTLSLLLSSPPSFPPFYVTCGHSTAAPVKRAACRAGMQQGTIVEGGRALGAADSTAPPAG